MASYIQAGFRVERTDANRKGEFRVATNDQWVHVECKRKYIPAMAPRRVKTVYDDANRQLRQLMEQRGARALILVTCRTDPTNDDIPRLIECVSRGLDDLESLSLRIMQGKFVIELLPSSQVTTRSGVELPAGYDYAFAEATAASDATGGQKLYRGLGVAWRVLRPSGWIRSALDSIRQAARQLPEDSPNLIYLHVCSDDIGAVITRIDALEPHVHDLLSNPERHRRLNAVVLTGEANVVSAGVATIRYIYRPIANISPSYVIASEIPIFGRDFTRR